MPIELSEQAQYVFRAAKASTRDLMVVSFDGTEGLSQLFHYRLLLASEDRELKAADFVGQAGVMSILMNPNEGETGHPEDPSIARFVNGIVSRFEHQMDGTTYSIYEAELVPFVWLLLHRTNCRIFQKSTTKDIITKVLTDAGLTTEMFRFAIADSGYHKRDYCVQYEESEWDFICRLAEDEGIFYFFEHTENGHVLVFADSPEAHVPIVGVDKIPYNPDSGLVTKEHINTFRLSEQIYTGSTATREFEFRSPGKPIEEKKEGDQHKELEYYNFNQTMTIENPSASKEEDKDSKFSEQVLKTNLLRKGEFYATKSFARGRTTCRRFQHSQTFKLEDHPRTEVNVAYVLTHMRVVGDQRQSIQADTNGAEGGEKINYQAEFQCIPMTLPYRPPRITPKPYARGTQTAIVVGPSADEIYTDKYGRIKVRFHWDREGEFDEKASCWVRVNQLWAGGKYGHFFLPRIGQEVIVDFLNGDFDQPIVIGSVYNGDHMPPYPLPAEKTKSVVFKTNSSLGGEGANELRIEDKKGEEQIFLHGEKNIHQRAKSNYIETTGYDKHVIIGHEYRELTKDNYSRKVEKSDAIEIVEDRNLTVGGKVVEAIGGDQVISIGGRLHIQAGTEIVLDAPSVSINGSGGFVLVDSDVTISGSQVLINSGGSKIPYEGGDPAAPAEAAAADTETPGADVDYTGKKDPPKPIPIPILPKKSWIKISLKDDQGEPMPGQRYIITPKDGSTPISGRLDINGEAHIGGLEPGQCDIKFPAIDDDEIDRA